MNRNLQVSINKYFTQIILAIAFTLIYLNGIAQTTSQTFTSSSTFTVPAGVTSIKVEVWGGGGAGGRAQKKNSAGGGGAGGSYAASVINNPSGNYTVTVGAAKTSATNNTASNNNGNPSWFGSMSTVYAIGGPGGTGSAQNQNGAGGTGTTTGCVGTVKFAGGNGSTGNRPPSNVAGGAGGGGAGSTGNGGNANAGTGGTGTPLSGGNGANGVGNSSNGAAGANYGGGGSGGKASNQNRNGGTGAAGLVKVTYLQSITGTLTVCAGTTTTLSNSASGGTWSSASSSVATVNSSTGNVTALAAGTSVITYSVPSGITGYNLTVTATVTVLAQPTAPTIGTITQPTCFSNTGSIVLNGLPSSGTWTITQYPGGATTSGTGTSTTISGLPSGTYSFTVTNASGCTSGNSANAVITSQPITPNEPVIGTITQPTCNVATGSVVLTSLPSSGNWTLVRYPGGITSTGTGASATISGLAAGTYNFTVTNSSGCTSSISDDVVVNSQPPTPSTPIIGAITQPTCTVTTGSVVLSGLPTGNWEIHPGNITGSGSTVTLTGLTAGTYNFTVTNESDCTSSATSDVVINPALPVPSIPTQSVDCSQGVNEARIIVTSPVGPGLEYSLNNGPYQSEPIFQNVGNGTFFISARNSSGCITVGNNFLVNCDCVYPPNIILSGTTGNTCGTTPITVSGNTFENAGNVYITTNGSGTVNPSSANTTPFSFTYSPSAADIGNTVKITFTSDNPEGAPCTPDIAEYSLTVNALPAAPAIGTITQPTCGIQSGSVVLNGLPGSGTWTITQTPGGNITGTGTSRTIIGLAPGTYTFTVTNSLGCSSGPSSNVTINALPTQPSAPTASVTIQPTCGVGTGTIVVSNPAQGSGFEYSIGGAYQASATFTGVTPGTKNVTVRWISDNTCISPATSVTVSPQPSPPSQPTASVTVQPTCAVPTGTIVVSSPAQGTGFEYSIGGAYQASTTFTGVSSGTKSVTVRRISDNTCVSPPTNVTVNASLGAPTAPTVSVTEQPTCDLETGTIIVSNPAEGTGFEYSIDGRNYQASVSFSGVLPGTKNVTVRRTSDNTCISPSTPVTVNAQPPTPPTPEVNVTYQSCSLGTITVTSPTGTGYTYILTKSSTGIPTASQSSTVFSGLSSDDYTIEARNSSGCTSASDEITLNPTPVIDEEPTNTTGCVGSTASFSVSTLLPEVTYQWQINTSGSNYSNISDNATYSGATTETLTISNLTSDLNNKKYKVIITRVSSSCSNTSGEATLTVTSCAPIASNNGPVCTGGTLNLYASTVPGATYSWTGPGSFSSSLQNPTRTGVTTAMAGPYSVTAKVGSFTSPAGTTTVIVNSGAPSAPTANSGTNAACDQITANWSATAGAASYRLDVSAANNFGSYVTGYQDLNVENVTTYIITGLNPGTTYYYRVRAVNGCGTSASSATITYATLPATPATPGTITGTPAQCPGLTGQTYSIATVTNATTYTWTVPTGWSITAGAGSTSITVTTGATGQNGNITVTAGNTCGTSAAQSLAVTVGNGTPSTPGAISGTDNQCPASTGQTYSIGSVTNATNYTWTVPTGWTITAGAGTTSITVTTGEAGQNGNISVTASNSCGTSTASNLAVIVNPGTPATPGAISGTATQCPALTGQTYSISPVANATTYNWTVPSGWSITSGNGTASITVNTGITGQNGDISVTAGNSCGTSAASSLTVTVGPSTPGAPQINAGSSAGCNQITANWTAAVNATSYRLDVSTVNNFTSYVTGYQNLNVGNVTAYIVTGLNPGTTYYYRVRATNSCGTSGNSGTTTYATSPVASVASVSGTTPLCIGSTATYTANSVVLSGGTGSWSSSNTSVATVNSSGLVTSVGAGTCNIIYTITGGCGGTVSAFLPLTVNALPLPPTTIGSQICIGSTATLMASGAGSGQVYRWYSAASGGTPLKTSSSNTDNTYITPVISATTNYWVSILNTGGCESTRTQVTATFPTISSDLQNIYGADSWIGYVYKRADGAAQAPSDANAYASFYGRITEQKSFNETFGGATDCLPLTATESARSIYTEYLAVKFLMNSSEPAGIYLADIGSDDGARLTVDGTKVYDRWVQRSYGTGDPKILFQLTGTSNLLLEYYESSGGNQVSFQNLLKVPNTIVSGKTQTICAVGAFTEITANNSYTGAPISGTAGFVVTYQWQQASDIAGPWNDITSATSMNYTPAGLYAGTHYFRRKLTVSKTNLGMGSPTIGTDFSDVATISVEAASVGGTIAGSATVCAGTNSTTLTLSGHTGNVVKWQSSTSSDFSSGVTDIANTSTSYTAIDISASSYYRAVVKNGSCTEAYSGTASVTIETTPPTFTNCPSNITADIETGLCTGVVSWTVPTVTDNCGGTPNVVRTNTAGITFNGENQATVAIGTSTITYTATDAAGNVATCSFNITVKDMTAPVVTCPPAQTVFCVGNIPVINTLPLFISAGGTYNDNAGSQCSSVIVSYSDNQVGNVVTRTYTITDGGLNTTTCQQVFTISQPTVTISSLNLNNTCAGGELTITSSVSGFTGTKHYQWQVSSNGTDWTNIGSDQNSYTGILAALGNQYRLLTSETTDFSAADCRVISNVLTFVDVTKPTFTSFAPANQTVCTIADATSTLVYGIRLNNEDVVENCTNFANLTISYTMTGATTSSGSNLTEGTSFNLGTTTVVYTVTDQSGNSETHTFTVTVNQSPAAISLSSSVLSGGGSGTSPNQCGEYWYYVTEDAASPQTGYSYTWKVFSGVGTMGTPLIAGTDYLIDNSTSPYHAASVKISWPGSLPPGTYTIEVIKAGGNGCDSRSTLQISLQGNFNLTVKDPGQDCKGESLGSKIINWEIARTCGTTSYSFKYVIAAGEWNTLAEAQTHKIIDMPKTVTTTSDNPYVVFQTVNYGTGGDFYTTQVFTLFIYDQLDGNGQPDINAADDHHHFYLKGIPNTSPITTD